MVCWRDGLLLSYSFVDFGWECAIFSVGNFFGCGHGVAVRVFAVAASLVLRVPHSAAICFCIYVFGFERFVIF